MESFKEKENREAQKLVSSQRNDEALKHLERDDEIIPKMNALEKCCFSHILQFEQRKLSKYKSVTLSLDDYLSRLT